MSCAESASSNFGDGATIATSTETGNVQKSGAGLSLTRLTGITGDVNLVFTDAVKFKAVLNLSIARVNAQPTVGFVEDIVETAADDDLERIEYRENAGKFRIFRTPTDSQDMLVETARGLSTALDQLGVP